MSTDRDFRGRSKGSLAILATLDAMPFAELQDELGPPDQVITIMREGGAEWALGDPRPALATEDVAAVQAMAHCLAWRAAGTLTASPIAGAVHPRTPCLWCDYPTREVLAAVDWAGWNSGLVEIAYATWQGAYGSHYDRATPAQGTYTNARWANFFGSAPSRDEAGRQRRSLIEAASYGGLPV